MSTLVRTQLLASLRAGVKELDDRIEEANRVIGEAFTKGTKLSALNSYQNLTDLTHERNVLIRKIEAAEEADDILWELVCAVNDAYDGEPLTQASLAAQLENHGLDVIRRAKP